MNDGNGAAMPDFLQLQSVDAILRIVRTAEPLPPEELDLARCLGRTLAEPLLADEDLPGFTRSTMDGYAVRARDVFGASEGAPALLDCVGECLVGQAVTLKIGPGQTARICTGGMLPQGADAVVMLEYARDAGEHQVELTRALAPGDHVVAADEDAAKGQLLIPAGRTLRPQEIGLLAALGRTQAAVRQRPRVAILSTGDEIIPVEAAPLPGQVRDVNSHSLAALAENAGAEARSFGLVKDDPQALRAAVETALDWADVLLVSGGSSAGRRDYTLRVFAGFPQVEILAHGVAISPGKPLILARRGGKTLWGMPGHVSSALVCGQVFIVPLIHALLGRADGAEARFGRIKAELARPVASAQGRRDYIRVALSDPEQEDAPPVAHPILGASGLISTLVKAEALIICPEDQEGLSQGQIVDAYLLS